VKGQILVKYIATKVESWVVGTSTFKNTIFDGETLLDPFTFWW
jgi:hypothetical protein